MTGSSVSLCFPAVVFWQIFPQLAKHPLGKVEWKVGRRLLVVIRFKLQHQMTPILGNYKVYGFGRICEILFLTSIHKKLCCRSDVQPMCHLGNSSGKRAHLVLAEEESSVSWIRWEANGERGNDFPSSKIHYCDGRNRKISAPSWIWALKKKHISIQKFPISDKDIDFFVSHLRRVYLLNIPKRMLIICSQYI